MTLKQNTAEGGTNGTAVTAANSGGTSGDAFTAVAPGTTGAIAFSSAVAKRGLLSYLFQLATAAACTVDMSDTAADTFAIRFYLYLNAYPSAQIQGPVGVRTAGNSSVGRLDMSATGQIRILLGTANAVSTFTTTTLALATWYRFEVYGTGMGTAASSMTCDVYVGDNTGTPYLTTTLGGQTTAGTVGIVRYGRINTAGSNDWYIDDIAQNIGTATPLGPAATSPAYTVAADLTGAGTLSATGVASFTANAGPDQINIEPMTTVTLTATGTGSWAQTSGTAVTLSPSGATATFTAPLTLNGDTLIFGYGGDTVSVTVLAATERIVRGGVEVAAYTTTTS